MEERFIPDVVSPVERPDGALCFAFCGDQLLVCQRDGQPTVTTLADLAQSNLIVEREYFLGHDGKHGPCFAADLGSAFQAPDRKSTRLNSSHSQQSRMPSSA